MNKISAKTMGLSFGATASLAYLTCIILMETIGITATTNLLSGIFHGIDMSKMKASLWNLGLGIVETFVFFWLIGACVAMTYNKLKRPDKNNIY